MNPGDIGGTRGIGVGLAAVVAQIVLLALAVGTHARTRAQARALATLDRSTVARQQSFAARLAISSVIPVLAVLAQMAYAVQQARGLMLESVLGGHPSSHLGAASAGLVQELRAILGGMLGLVVPLILGAVAAGLAISAGCQRAGLARAVDLADRDREAALVWASHSGPGAPSVVAVILAFVVLGLGPVIVGAAWGTLVQLRAFDEMARAAPMAKTAVFAQAQQFAGTLLERGFRLAIIGVACATIGAAFLLWLTSPSRARAQLLGRPARELASRGSEVVAGAIFIAVAIALVGFAWPMRRENATPWPPGSANDRLGIETPALDGPDGLGLGPLVLVTNNGLSFAGGGRGDAGVAAGLRAYRVNFTLLHPGEPLPREILLACAPDADSKHVLAAIEIARRAGYDSVAFVFESARQIVRPFIGNVTLNSVTAARVSIGVDDVSAPAAPERVRPENSSTCAQLAGRVVDLRRAGRLVILLPPPATIDRHQPGQE